MNSESTLITSGHNFEGYRITKYLGDFSGETLNFTREIRFDEYADMLSSARKAAVDTLCSRAKKAGANAIIGLSVHYGMFKQGPNVQNLLGVIAGGTAVYIERL